MNKIFIDTNIVLDEILKRNEFYENSHHVIEICKTKSASLAPHTVTNSFYIVSKIKNFTLAKQELLRILEFVDIVEVGKHQIIEALKNNEIDDFEDALQLECAKEFNADYFVTRDLELYKNDEVKVITPKEFIKLFG